MKDLRKLLPGVALSVALVAALILSGCAQVTSAGNDTTALAETTTPLASQPATSQMTTAAPAATETESGKVEDMPVVEMELSRLVAAFAADPEAARAEYAGRRFIFRDVYADNISSLFKPASPDMWVMNGNVKFRPEFPSLLTDLKVHSVMDIEGTVWGTQLAFIIIEDCRYTMTDTSEAIERPDFQFTFE